MTLAYNALLRNAHGRAGLRTPDYPARTLGILPWTREAPLSGPVLQAPSPTINMEQLLQAQAESSYEGEGGRGSLSPDPKTTQGQPWYGPGVM